MWFYFNFIASCSFEGVPSSADSLGYKGGIPGSVNGAQALEFLARAYKPGFRCTKTDMCSRPRCGRLAFCG